MRTKNLPYDELARVPLLIRFPDLATVNQPETVDTVVQTIDTLPTFLDLADTDYSNEMTDRPEGESLLPVIECETPSYDVVLTEKKFAVRTTYDSDSERADRSISTTARPTNSSSTT